jgi:antitoxin (DNA-binding transcriptional repressor) of toxin-antitoxin stability system
MVITSNGRPVAILAAVSESNLEESLAAFRRARAVDALASLQRRAAASEVGKLSVADIEAEITAVREARRK